MLFSACRNTALINTFFLSLFFYFLFYFSGNLMEPPFQSQKKFGTSFTKLDKKTIRGKKYDSDSDDD